MTPEELTHHYPFLYHMAEPDSWPNMQSHGLRSTSALLDLYEVEGRDRVRIEECRRPESITISHPSLPPAVIRDNKPLSDAKLGKALVDGTSISEWYRLLNGKVFFWTTTDRLKTFLNASSYRKRAHIVITVRTSEMILAHENDIWLTSMNTGSTSPMGHPRGLATFKRVVDFPFESRRKSRALKDIVVELAVDRMVPDIEALTERVEVWAEAEMLETIWTPA